MNSKLALVTGSFDPITCGHIDIVRRASAVFDRVIVLVAQNEGKKYMFSSEERKRIAQVALGKVENVSVECWDGYVADFARANNADAFVRGIRDGNDVEYEQVMANKNFELCSVDTVMLFSKPCYHDVSSTAVRALLEKGEDASEYMDKASFELAKNILTSRKDAVHGI